jgi:hypothetical protein
MRIHFYGDQKTFSFSTPSRTSEGWSTNPNILERLNLVSTDANYPLLFRFKIKAFFKNMPLKLQGQEELKILEKYTISSNIEVGNSFHKNKLNVFKRNVICLHGRLNTVRIFASHNMFPDVLLRLKVKVYKKNLCSLTFIS